MPTFPTPFPTLPAFNGVDWATIVDLDVLSPSTFNGQVTVTAQFGSGVTLGNGIVLTASHVLSNPFFGAPSDQDPLFYNTYSYNISWQNLNGANQDLVSGWSNPAVVPTMSNAQFVNYGGYGGFLAQTGDDLGLINVGTSVGASMNRNSMIIFSDPGEAQGALFTAGYPTLTAGGEISYYTTGSLTLGSYQVNPVNGRTADNFVWFASNNFDFSQGQSGAGVWLEYDPDGPTGPQNARYFLAGMASQTDGTVEPISDSYAALGNQLSSIFGPGFGSLFATNVLIADKDGIGPNGQLNDFVQGTGFNEDIYIDSLMGITVNGGGGFDTINYASLSGGIDFIQGPNSISALRDNGPTDTLSNIDYIIGSVFADTFDINNFLFSQSLQTIIGNSVVPPFNQNLTDKDGNSLESADGGRNLSAAAALAASGQLHMLTGDEDTISVSQALFDAGAQVTYLTAQGEGVIWLEQNGITQMISYTGIFNEVGQTAFFDGLDNGGTTGLNETGGLVLDLSTSSVAIDAALLGGISLFNLVDEFIGSDLGDTIDLALTGLENFFGMKRLKIIWGINFSGMPTRLARVGYSHVIASNDNGKASLAA